MYNTRNRNVVRWWSVVIMCPGGTPHFLNTCSEISRVATDRWEVKPLLSPPTTQIQSPHHCFFAVPARKNVRTTTAHSSVHWTCCLPLPRSLPIPPSLSYSVRSSRINDACYDTASPWSTNTTDRPRLALLRAGPVLHCPGGSALVMFRYRFSTSIRYLVS